MPVPAVTVGTVPSQVHLIEAVSTEIRTSSAGRVRSNGGFVETVSVRFAAVNPVDEVSVEIFSWAYGVLFPLINVAIYLSLLPHLGGATEASSRKLRDQFVVEMPAARVVELTEFVFVLGFFELVVSTNAISEIGILRINKAEPINKGVLVAVVRGIVLMA